MQWLSENNLVMLLCYVYCRYEIVVTHTQQNVIGVGTGERAVGPGPSQYFTLETLLMFIHAAQLLCITLLFFLLVFFVQGFVY